MSEKQPRRIKASRELQQKVGTGVIDEKAVAAAQKVMDDDPTDFVILARPDLEKLQEAIDFAKRNLDQPDEVMAGLKEPIMNIKSNAGVFKYDFVSQLTGAVLMLFENIEQPDKKLVQIADVLHKTILLAIAYQMKGDGGNNGRALVEAFQTLCKKYSSN